jgi:DNA-binding protein H-NS
MSTYRNVKAQIVKLEKQASDLFKKEVADVIAKARALISEYGLSAADLGLSAKPGKGRKATRKNSATAKPAGIPMYVDPVSGKTWTGKGKQPGWIVDGLKKGKSKVDFLIGKKASTASVAKKAAKVAKVVKTVKQPTSTRKAAAKKRGAKTGAAKAAAAKA